MYRTMAKITSGSVACLHVCTYNVPVAEFANGFANILARKVYMQNVVVLQHDTLISVHGKPVDQSI